MLFRSRGNLLATPVGAGVMVLVVLALIALIVVATGAAPNPSNTPLPSCGTPNSSNACSSGTPVVPTPTPSLVISPSPSFVRPTPTPGPTFISYVVKSGETLSSIARNFSTSPRSIAWWNRGTYPTLDPESEAYAPNHIEPGWTLTLMPGVIVDDANAPSPSPGNSGPLVTPTATQGG